MSVARKPYTVVREPNGLTDVPGFACGATASGIRGPQSDRLDLGLVYSETPCTAAGVFTQNKVCAAPVHLCRERLAAGERFHGVLFNSGNANACTGEQGRADAEALLWAAESAIGAPDGSFFICSTGRIGRDLPMKRMIPGVRRAAEAIGTTPAEGHAAADCILTSDTRRKVSTVKVKTAEGAFTIAGIAKGAGMIEPNMATMLAFIVTDAAVPARTLQKLLNEGVGPSFNAITVDGDMSTNDTVLALANGVSGVRIRGELKNAFAAAFNRVCEDLAQLIVGDGEKITKVVELRVSGARNADDARKVARAVGNSLLVKSSWYGNDPNWGRVVDAAGYSGADLVEEKLTMAYRASDGAKPVPAFEDGRGVERHLARWKKIVAQQRFIIELDLGLGRGTARLFASDLTEGYVNFNKSE
ncbi:MAG: bifunctional glutamate N-acetyltransferase/amino-acid acetyltransferase ArgJ [Opitutales bacterium]